jgi:small subunit ribosomal protein S2
MSLFQTGTHRGNSKSKLNPSLRSRVYGFQNNLCIIDLVKTIDSINQVGDLLSSLGEKKRQVLLVGTSDHIKGLLPGYSEKFTTGPMPYINSRWLGGTLTNWSTVRKTLKKLEKLDTISKDEDFFNKLSRNEQLNLSRQKTNIAKFFEGLRTLKNNRPGALLLVDGPNNPIAIKEADMMGIPVIVLTNTSIQVLPKSTKNVIIANINSTNTVSFILDNLVHSYNEGVKLGFEKKSQELENTEK